MEETTSEIIYDLENTEAIQEQESPSPDNPDNPDNSDNSDNPENSENTENSDNTENSENSDNSDNSENSDTPESNARSEIDRMVEKMGAETLLAIIRDNRNAAIRQIVSEVEAAQDRSLPSGGSISKECRSIFDLAALA